MTGISISVASDTRAFASGVKSGVLEPLESVDAALKKVGAAGEAGGDKLVAALKAEQQQTKLAGRDALDLATTVRRSEQQQTASVELSAREQKKLRREALTQASKQAKQAVEQSASSIDGTLAGFTGAASGAAIGVLASLPPQFALIGGAGIAALGLIDGALTSNDQHTQEFKQHVAELAGELIAAGADGSISLDYVVKSLQKLAVETDSNKTSLGDLFDAAKGSGNSAKDLALAYAGQADQLAKLTKQADAKLKIDRAASQANQVSKQNAQQGSAASRQEASDLLFTANAQQRYTSYLHEAADAAKAAKKEQQDYAAAGGPELETKANLIKSIDSAYDQAAGSVDSFVNSESGVLDTDRYIAAMAAKQKALEDYQQTLASSGLSAQAKSFLSQQGADAAATLLEAYKTGTAAQKASLAAIWNEAGSASSAAYTKALKNGLPATLPGPVVSPQVDLTEATRSLRKLTDGSYLVTVGGVAQGKRIF